ncbi:hypothetical protein [Alteromonas sp. ASW11-130]|uniref:hypothetical protein n=1 Tax=Alteromonas sp. ASW11-130 TaxID=3015775 RepID=UPI002242B411|nr:hypothetical protein [Alteromonas sp. ASW11-130]MCW8093289.1 hypothetical protein [Alteromonas sp. ASW11-130]
MPFFLNRWLKQVSTSCSTLLLGLSVLMIGCNNAAGIGEDHIQLLMEKTFGPVLQESSGLYCADQGLVTVNDSGNYPALYFMDYEGNRTFSKIVAKHNNDWESLTADRDFYYVGDVGNNNGVRTDLGIIKANKHTWTDRNTLHLSYQGYAPGEYMIYHHDYDAEAMVVRGDELFLISKSWDSGIAKVYNVDKNKTKQILTPAFYIKGLPGVVTGADYDAQNDRYVVVGYDTTLIAIFNPFLAVLTTDWQVQQVYPLTHYSQVEGVCVRNNGDIYFTQEKSPFDDSKLVKIRLRGNQRAQDVDAK